LITEYLCDEASLLPDEEARLAALECLILGPGPLSSPLPDATRARFSNLLAANMVGSSQSFRRKVKSRIALHQHTTDQSP
jgi:hypothetical protein